MRRTVKIPQSIKSSAPSGRPRRDRGYAYIMALGMLLVLAVSSQIILRNIVTEARSQREAEMIWRGNQIVRAIRAYYRKTGHYPQTMDDLNTGVPDLHFLRSEAMKDPMNKSDGSWRFIYTNATGAILGSVKYASMQQMALMDMNGGVLPGGQAQTQTGNNGTGDQNGLGATGPGATGNGASGTTGTGLGSPQSGGSQTGLFGLGSPGTTGPAPSVPGLAGGLLAAGAGNGLISAQPTGAVDGPQFGGQLVGVGSKVDASGVRVYKGESNYKNWEFIWNPLEEQARAVQQGLGGNGALGTGLPGLPVGSIGTGGPAPGTGAGGPGAPPPLGATPPTQ